MTIQAEEIFKENHFLVSLLDYSQDVFWVRHADYERLIYVNMAYEHLFGRTCQSLYQRGDSWLNALNVSDKAYVDYEINQIKHNTSPKYPHKMEYQIIRPDGHQRRILEVVVPILDREQQLLGFCGIAKDVTPPRLRLSEFEQASQYFKFFAEKVRSVFWARDTTCNKQLYLSPGYEKIWQRSCASLYENPDSWLETLHPEDRNKASNTSRLEELEMEGQDVQYEYRYRIFTPEGSLRWIKDTSFPIQNENGQFIGFAGIAEDITKEVLHEQQLREAIQTAEVANQAKSDFLAMISHELRTPLNAILGMAQILKSKGISPQLEEYVDIISNAGNGLLSLVSDILDFAKLEAGKLSFANEPFNLKHLFSQVINSLQYQANDKHITLSLECSDDISTDVFGDPNRVRQVLMNLLSNALKFTDSGYIRVSVQAIKQSKEKSLFEVQVKDTGIGIRQDKLVTVFEKFSQVDSIYKRKHGGIGLGLAITKQLVEAMGGEIYVTSEYGHGSTFRFTMPLQLQKDVSQKTVQLCEGKGVGRRQYPMNVLLVEDNLINQKIAATMLRDFGCDVTIADTGLSVLDRIDELDAYHLIFMDIGLPDVSGFDVVKKIRSIPHLQRKPIVAMTAHILDRDRQQAFEVGMDRMLAKPISYEEIGAVLEEVSRSDTLKVH